MPTKPTNIPNWATDEEYNAGPDIGLETKLEPTSGEIANGFRRGSRAPARKTNWLLNALCAWRDWTEESVDEHTATLTNHGSRITSLEGYRANISAYGPGSAPNQSNVTVDYQDVGGRLNVVRGIGGELVTVHFYFPFIPLGAGLKSVELPTPGSFAPSSNFSFHFGAFGHGTSQVGVSSDFVPVMIQAVTGTTRVRVEWHSSHSTGTGIVRGTYMYQR